MARATRVEIRNERTRQVIDRVNTEIEDWTMAQLEEHNMTHRTRMAAENAYKKVICGRKYLVVPRHTDEEQFFLRLMVLYAMALRPGLQPKANEVADYLSTNYPYEWTQFPTNRPAVRRARDMILSAAESQFGETPMAAPLAYVYHHHETLKIENVSNYGECYARAAGLVRLRHFHNSEQAWRERLGLHQLHKTT
ncbi:MAG: hypothetical protein U9R79_20190 [Armatimonadota bacterium]|nr:hypothetical protein [Armatimonadota bacterium]